jgi:SPP1 family predicted phage head-tail adaptor
MKTVTGAYDRRVTLMTPSGTVVVDGMDQTNYSPGATIWAAVDVKPPKGRQLNVAEADHSASTRWIKIRYIAGILSTWRIRYGTTVFKIMSPPIDEGMRHRELYIECEVVE